MHFGGEDEPGGRQAAPGQLSQVQAFVNTFYDRQRPEGGEALRSPRALSAWLTEHALLAKAVRTTAADLRQALELRESLRALVGTAVEPGGGSAGLDPWGRLDQASTGLCAGVSFARGEPRFVARPRDVVSGALGVLVVITAVAMLDGSWSRLKTCPGLDCGWAFYDHSRNQSGKWCSMSICGSRSKARAHYRRQRSG